VPRDRIHLEDRSTNTHENAEFSRPLLARLGAHRLLLVTDHMHMRRAEASFGHYGFETRRASVPVFAGSRDNVWMLRSGLREFAALAYYRSKGWLSTPPAGGTPVPTQRPGGGAMSPNSTMPPGSPPGTATAPIVLIGASYAGGWNLPAVAGRPVVNKGVAGESSSQMLTRFDRDVIALGPRAVVIWGYINDIHHAPPDQGDAAKAKAKQNVLEMIRRARAAGIEPIVVTELTRRASDAWGEWLMGLAGSVLGKEGHQARINRHVLDLNAWLRDTAKREGLLVIDLQPALSDADGQRRKAFCKEDGSHVTEAGYRAATAYALPILTQHFVAR
jgi:lysophospholipase L1-like esterase